LKWYWSRSAENDGGGACPQQRGASSCTVQKATGLLPNIMLTGRSFSCFWPCHIGPGCLCCSRHIFEKSAPYPRVGAEASMSAGGQKAKYSPRADVFRSAPDSGHRAMQPACPFRANSGSERTHSITSSAVARSVSSRSCRAWWCTVSPALALSPTAGACGNHGPIVGAQVAPHIAVPRSAEISVWIAIFRMRDD